jgi:metal-responsive CopG/Arc/MetJ family transcriptional regulator
MKTIQMTIDARLLKAVDKLTKIRKTSRSAFIRAAVEAELRRERLRVLEDQHIAGYRRQPVTVGEFDVWLTEQDWGTG